MPRFSRQLKVSVAPIGSFLVRTQINLVRLFVLVLPISFLCYSQELRSKAWAGYYPLAVGNSWTYSVTGKSGPGQIVWKVLNAKVDVSGQVFAVWPTPLDSDDSGMNLKFTSEGLRELSSDFFVLRFPMTTGKTWSVGSNGQSRVFVVLGEGEPCSVGKLKFKECAIVREDDPSAKL
jgi:hypothetical protein